MNTVVPDAGSFRDPSGYLYELKGRIFRTVTARAAAGYEFVRESGFLSRITDKGWFVGVSEVDPSVVGPVEENVCYVVEHPPIPFVSYPYEWSFSALKSAALLHLDLHIEALNQKITLSDASAYNVQFIGARPVFIDLLSLRPYRDGEFWLGHRQFCEQFLNPLLVRALFGIPHNAWYRGNLEGIPASELSPLLSLRHKVSWKILSHVALPARFQRRAVARESNNKSLEKIKERKLPLVAYSGMLKQLRNWIAKLDPKDAGKSVWSDYAETHTYGSDEDVKKRRFVSEFINRVKPKTLWDLGCNTGEYAEVALDAGAGYVVGFDSDQGALDAAFGRARARELNFLPLYLDAANPSPDQGWALEERKGLEGRANADAILALAFEHHLAIARNVPLHRVVGWLTKLAPAGVIEFVEKGDPTVQKMLALREDIFDGYGQEQFVSALKNCARIVKTETVSASGRQLFWYERS
ncbi:MAG: class I SAM-dependent methyltransferase [Planctomycetota bacterium]